MPCWWWLLGQPAPVRGSWQPVPGATWGNFLGTFGDLPESKWKAGQLPSPNSYEMGRYLRENMRPGQLSPASNCFEHWPCFSEHNTCVCAGSVTRPTWTLPLTVSNLPELSPWLSDHHYWGGPLFSCTQLSWPAPQLPHFGNLWEKS